ncbi:HFM1 ATP-dependent DNA helicase MER3 [Candida maltosa Xu316]
MNTSPSVIEDRILVSKNLNTFKKKEPLKSFGFDPITPPVTSQPKKQLNISNHYTRNVEPRPTESTYSSDIGQLKVDIIPYNQRCVFPFKKFNEMQSQCFPVVYHSSKNCVISSPTGSGKTVLFELAIMKEFADNASELDFKVLYLAPTKALCSEKLEDWTKKFAQLNITVGILTGDTTFKETEKVKKSNIIISTPEKWDMITRKWKDYSKLFGLIKLLLVDEIHFLKESRGSTLEVVITRMKRICIGLRILAISATVANAQDISKWIKLETLCFGEEYRAVQLYKIVYGYKPTSENDFQFDIHLNSKLIEVIKLHSKNKPVLIFCPTRNSSQATAKFLFNNLPCNATVNLKLKDRDVASYATKGIAYHHAGLSFADRKQIENSFLNGELKILCSTSTLAVGINLPAYLVIIKGTKCWAESCFQEYSETDILQMVGRAGRPQFETEGVAVIMTTAKLKQKYERLVKGTEKVESSLHMNFTEHLAAEIAVGVVKNITDALDWLKTTYLYVRFMENPAYYVLKIAKSSDPEETLIKFCKQQAQDLYAEKLITMDELQNYKITPYGYSMTMHYISFQTMKIMVRSGSQLSVGQVLDLLTSASEFSDLKLKHNEKRLYKELNSSPMVRYASKNKVKLLIDFELGGVDYPNYNGAMKIHSSFLGDKFFVFKHIHRLIMAVLDVFIEKKDSKSLHSSGYLLRCINGRCWEDSPNELRQLDGIGPASVKKFCNHNVLSLEDAKSLTTTQIEYYLGLKTGAGNKIRKNIMTLPNLQLEMIFDDEEITIDVPNAQASSVWKNRPVYIHLITDTSTGELIDFRRIPVTKFKSSGAKSFQVNFSVKNLDQTIRCHAYADSIASVKTNTSVSLRTHLSKDTIDKFIQNIDDFEFTVSDDDIKPPKNEPIDDGKVVVQVENNVQIEIIELDSDTENSNQPMKNINAEHQVEKERKILPNGNYACNHFCKDKQNCRHLCCREGLPVKKKRSETNSQKLSNKVAKNDELVATNDEPVKKENELPDPIHGVKKSIQPRKIIKFEKKNIPYKRTIFDDSDPDDFDFEVDEKYVIPEVKKAKKLNSTVFSINDDVKDVDRTSPPQELPETILDTNQYDDDSIYNYQCQDQLINKTESNDECDKAISNVVVEQDIIKEDPDSSYDKQFLQNLLGSDIEID